MESILRALAEPRRLRILTLVRARELCAGAIAEHFRVSRPAVSQHLKILRETGLLHERRKGTKRFYRARPEGLLGLRAFLDAFWGGRLDRLKRVAERAERRRRHHARR